MQTATIEMDKWSARRAWRDYRKHVGPESTKEDKALMECYRVLARGVRVLDLQRTMTNAGCKSGGHLPQLAVCRADAARCQFTYRAHPDEHRIAPHFKTDIYTPHKRRLIDTWLLPGTFSVTNWQFAQSFGLFHSQVPIIPPALRPKKDLHRYLILWEAEWSRVPQKDPILLRPIGAGMYAIVAQWNMTPLEAAIAAGRL